MRHNELDFFFLSHGISTFSPKTLFHSYFYSIVPWKIRIKHARRHHSHFVQMLFTIHRADHPTSSHLIQYGSLPCLVTVSNTTVLPSLWQQRTTPLPPLPPTDPKVCVAESSTTLTLTPTPTPPPENLNYAWAGKHIPRELQRTANRYFYFYDQYPSVRIKKIQIYNVTRRASLMRTLSHED